MNKQELYDYIDAHADTFVSVSDKIWEYAELSLKEFRSAALYCDILRENGFTVSESLCGVPTAFSGSWGSGRPVIGILGEFDALSGLSQEGGIAEKRSAGGETGHGCNHNLLGAGALGAVFAVKDYLMRSRKSGTVVFFGCPGEEGGAGKAFMARDRAWESLDAAITWHPDYVNCVVSGSCLSCIQKEYIFDGISAHAAGDPEHGRSALDAVELMNIGVQYLREHIPSAARIHYAITDGGGVSPNVVQPHASVLYMVRDHEVGETLKLQQRVDNIAQAAAMMTDTRLTIRFIDGCSNTVPNRTLEQLANENLRAAPLPEYTAQELDYAQALVNSFPVPATPVATEFEADLTDSEIDYVNQMSENGSAPINRFVLPYHHSRKVHMGSTDVGDVSWQTPTVQVYTACQAAGSPGHSWQLVSSGRSSIGYKGMLFAAKVMAGIAADLFEQPETLETARQEHRKDTAAGYLCPIPDGAPPTAL
ncbi:MAG: amidohydrolase [Ruminococcaceae bacterium]|nr:amidohydrolase [Oscillospiraceae bacterium]